MAQSGSGRSESVEDLLERTATTSFQGSTGRQRSQSMSSLESPTVTASTDVEDAVSDEDTWETVTEASSPPAAIETAHRAPAPYREMYGDPSVRADRRNQTPTAENAQGLFLPAAAVFVANLPKEVSDGNLHDVLKEVFSKFGQVFVLVRRDANGIPNATLQFTTPQDADQAIEEGDGANILGRSCRVEVATASRTLYVLRWDRRAFDFNHVIFIASFFGTIEHWERPSELEAAHLGLPPSVVFIKFKYFLDCQDALKGLRRQQKYKFELVGPKKEKPVTAVPRDTGRHGHQEMGMTDGSPAPFLQGGRVGRYPVDRTLYCGNLPVGVTEQQLRALFSPYGVVEHVDILQQKANGPGYKPFSFVVFGNGQACMTAVQRENGRIFFGVALRVESKRSETHGNARVPAMVQMHGGRPDQIAAHNQHQQAMNLPAPRFNHHPQAMNHPAPRFNQAIGGVGPSINYGQDPAFQVPRPLVTPGRSPTFGKYTFNPYVFEGVYQWYFFPGAIEPAFSGNLAWVAARADGILFQGIGGAPLPEDYYNAADMEAHSRTVMVLQQWIANPLHPRW